MIESHDQSKQLANVTLREWLAGQAMAGILAADQTDQKAATQVADEAVMCADRLLAALAKGG